ncbi:hypothetical protein chiPu_0022986, partial [Chiloscyllium punctatum]|nr:hypothetical protein [Chiloscyllium punctatum]
MSAGSGGPCLTGSEVFSCFWADAGQAGRHGVASPRQRGSAREPLLEGRLLYSPVPAGEQARDPSFILSVTLRCDVRAIEGEQHLTESPT